MAVAFVVLLAAALCCMLLSFVPWVQTNMRWMTSFKFYMFLGLLIGGALILLIRRVASGLTGF